MSYSSSSRLRRFATNPIPVTAARTPSNTDPIDDSVPVLGNSFWDLPVDPEVFPTCEFEWFAEFETDVLAEADALVDAEAEALVLAEAEALVLAEADALVDAEADALVEAEAEALVVSRKPLAMLVVP
ncbi:Uncharacterised protein [Streptococcus pneumoniae]|nr:Uncharacterised protein [Streptococcus pneumoniae]